MKVGERLGVNYRFNSNISSIKLSTDGKTATGVNLTSGESLDADIVICNADLVYAYNNLLPPSSYATSLEKRPGSCSSISFYWALDTKVPALSAHNIFLADEYKSSFDSIFKDQDMPAEPSFYVNVPSRVDPSAAPADRDTVVVLCPVGHMMSEAEGKGLNPQKKQDFDALINKARNAVLSTVEARTGVALKSHITHEKVNDPQSWKDEFNLDKGAILGLSHSFFNVLSFRPNTKHASIKNMYFVGASTHPGTGVPIVLAGSKITSEQILGDNGMEVPWGEGVSLTRQRKRKVTSDIDHVDRVQSYKPLLSNFYLFLVLLLLAYITTPWLMQHRGQILSISKGQSTILNSTHGILDSARAGVGHAR